MGYAGGTHGFNPKSYWAGIIPYECEWTWYLCDVKPGPSRVRFQGAAARPDVKLGLWLWSDRDCAAGQQTAADRLHPAGNAAIRGSSRATGRLPPLAGWAGQVILGSSLTLSITRDNVEACRLRQLG